MSDNRDLLIKGLLAVGAVVVLAAVWKKFNESGGLTGAVGNALFGNTLSQKTTSTKRTVGFDGEIEYEEVDGKVIIEDGKKVDPNAIEIVADTAKKIITTVADKAEVALVKSGYYIDSNGGISKIDYGYDSIEQQRIARGY